VSARVTRAPGPVLRSQSPQVDVLEASRVPEIDGDAQRAVRRLTVSAPFGTMPDAPVADLAGAGSASVVVPLPGAAAREPPQRVAVPRVRKVAQAVRVVVRFRARDVTAGETHPERDMGVGTRHGGPPRVGTAPARVPSAKDEPGLWRQPLARSCPHAVHGATVP
jgi:hypothetical protein